MFHDLSARRRNSLRRSGVSARTNMEVALACFTAEIYREMGNFEEAKKAFTGEFDEEYMDTMDILDKLIEARDSRVMCINPHDD